VLEWLIVIVVVSEVDAYICRTKQGRNARALWGISWYHWMYDVIAGVSHKTRSF